MVYDLDGDGRAEVACKTADGTVDGAGTVIGDTAKDYRSLIVPTDGTVRLGLHVGRGNWSRDERTLLSGSYQALRPYLNRLQITQLVLEYATDRAGSLVAFEDKELGLGVVNPRTEQIETPVQIRSAVEKALDLYPAERLFLNPDCGFGTFSNRPMNTREIALAKVAAMTAAARDLRGRSG